MGDLSFRDVNSETWSDFEALFEVKGQKHVNLEAQVVASYPLDGEAIWSGERANTASYPEK